jgi:hypothetical protein
MVCKWIGAKQRQRPVQLVRGSRILGGVEWRHVVAQWWCRVADSAGMKPAEGEFEAEMGAVSDGSAVTRPTEVRRQPVAEGLIPLSTSNVPWRNLRP